MATTWAPGGSWRHGSRPRLAKGCAGSTTGTARDKPRTEPEPTGIDYLALLGDAHDSALRGQVSYRDLITPSGQHQHQQEQEQREEGDGRD